MVRFAEEIDLDKSDFEECIDSNLYEEYINNSLNYARQIGVSGAPTIFINGLKINGSAPFSTIEEVIEELTKTS